MMNSGVSDQPIERPPQAKAGRLDVALELASSESQEDGNATVKCRRK